jgi:protein-S-isoprenylcysteine O-methyltransferase Ste14
MKRPVDRRERPNVVTWPPVVFIGTIGAGMLLGYAVPLGFLLPAAGGVRLIGVGAMLAGIVVDGTAMLVMRRARANIQPHRAATALVTTGPFAWSRNPIYLGNTVLIAGAALVFGNPWLLLMAAVTARLVSLLAIRREEEHLALLFGDAWIAYAQRTPRWLRIKF